MKPQEISRKVVTEAGFTTTIQLPELVKGVHTTIHVSHDADQYASANDRKPVVTTVWITQEKESNATD